MQVAVGSTVFTVELEVFIVASQRLVWKTPTASFCLASTVGPLGSCGNCLQALDSDSSRSLCKDTVRSTLTLAYSPGVSYRILLQLVVDLWVGSQELLEGCGSFVTAIGTAFHMVVVPGHAYLLTLWVPRKSRHQRVMPSAHSTSPKPSLFIDSKTTGGRKPLLDEILKMPSWPLCSQGLDVSTSWEGVGSGVFSPSPEMYMQIRGGLAIYLPLMWSEMCACEIEAFLFPTELRVWLQCSDPQITLCPEFLLSAQCLRLHCVFKNSWKPNWRQA